MAKRMTGSPRSRALTLLGFIYLLIGIAQYTTADQVTGVALKVYKAHLAFMSIQAWGVLFVIAGVLALTAALLGKHTLGFFSTMYMSTIWCMLFVVSFILTGYGRIVPNILIWGFVAAIIYVMSAWPDPVGIITPVNPPKMFDFENDKEQDGGK